MICIFKFYYACQDNNACNNEDNGNEHLIDANYANYLL